MTLSEGQGHLTLIEMQCARDTVEFSLFEPIIKLKTNRFTIVPMQAEVNGLFCKIM